MNDSISDSPRRPRKGRAKLAVIAAVAVALAGFGAWKLLGPKDEEGGYMTAVVEYGNIEDLVSATGILEPRDYVDVGAQVSGQIEKIYVEVGDVVKKGDKLAKIDATTSEARMDASRAQLEGSKTSLLTQKENLAKAERDLKRQENLLKEDATTQEAYLNAKTTYENAVRSVRSQELSIAQQEANMRVEAKNLGYTEITAPIDGTVMSIAVKEGQSVNASQSVPNVLRLANLGTMTVRTDVSEADVSRVKVGMSAYFTLLSSNQNRRWFGEVKRLEPTPKTQQGVVLFPALFDVENDADQTLKSQMTTQVFFVVAERRNVLTVPMAALQQGQQIAREMAQKEREKAAAAPGGAAPAGNNMAAGGMPAGVAGSAPPGVAPEAAGAGPEAGPGAAPGGQQAGGPPRGNRGNGGPGGAGGFGGGFNGQQLTPEQIEQFRAARGGGGAGGAGGFGGGFRGMGGMGGAGGQQQTRRGIVMVKKADGTLEQRQVVVGVNDRVRGEVIEGLSEGEEVVVGKRETEPQTGPTAAGATNNNNQNNNFRGQGGGGFPGGGGGGNFRPF